MGELYFIWFVTVIVIYLSLYHTEWFKTKFKEWLEKF